MLRVIRRIPDKRIPWRTRQNPEYKSCRFFNSHSKKFLFGSLPSVKTYSSHQHQTKKSGGGGTLLALSAFALAGGATLGYAKYDPDFRKVLVEYVPFTDTLIKILFVEEGEGNILSNTYGNIKSTIIDLVSGGSRSKTGRTVTPVPEPQEYKAPPPIVPAIEKETKKPEPTYNEIRLERKDKGQPEPKVEIVGEVKPTSNEAEGFDTANLRELEDNICKSAEEAVNAYNKAVFILKTYNQDIEYIIDEAVNEIKPEMWDEVRRKTRSKQECIRRAQEKADEATKDINKLKEMVSSPKFDVPATTKDLIRTNISKVQEDIVKAKKELEAEQKSGSVTEKYWDKVEKARNHFSLELESLFPCIDISQKELRVNEEDLDLFVLHTYANVLFYQKELAKMETIIQEKVRQAVEAARKGGGEPLTNAQICEALDQEKRRLALCFQQQLLKVRKEADNELREQLKRQSQAFSDHLHEAINIKAEEIERVLTRKYDELLEAERCQYKIQLATAVGRLKGLDQAIREKKNAEETAKQAQVLWSACQSLLRAIKAGCPGMPWKSQIRPLEPEITAVRKAAAQNDELVSAVLNGIPKEAKERGVYPEDALRERFLKVEQVARTVALVPEDGAALPIHILSYLQSLLLIKAASPIPQSELNDEKVDFSKLDTNDILQRARYWLDRGDFAQTLKYMNLLKGAPRCVARQWMNETRILLETQQAANTLMAHAASSGLMYL
ncbi:MICOS complex subunit Mic60 isoform X1 [Anoplophora glabripennis]|uniref:MICOS complex subunit Mic60 isoform X1 n=1 Tax=Anoplophora glabripennis TaxID=217634 RepID=UPI000875664A|nr:MICOS complex subunit Mic60 isoform X1 [Anoplophora glabripennis]